MGGRAPTGARVASAGARFVLLTVLTGLLVTPSAAIASTGWSPEARIDHTTRTEQTSTVFPPGETQIVESPSRLTSISCASSTFCVAVDNAGYAFTYNGVLWSAPVLVAPGFACGTATCSEMLLSVSCPSSSFCVASDLEGNAYVYNGSSWSTPDPIDPAGDGIPSVSCPTASFCAAVDYNDNAMTYNGSSWTSPERVDGKGNEFHAFFSVSCPTSAFCAAVDDGGQGVLYKSGLWSPPSEIDNSELLSVSCASSSFCAAVDPNSKAVVYNGGSWSGEPGLDSVGQLWSVACPSSSFCLAGDTAGRVITYNGSSWSTPTRAAESEEELRSISCSSTAFCAAVVEPRSVITYTAAVPPPTVTGLEPSSGPTSGGTPVTIDGTNLGSVTAVKFGSAPASSFERLSEGEIKAVSPPGSGTVEVTVEGPGGTSASSAGDRFSYFVPVEQLEFKNWLVSGTLTDKRLGQAIALPSGSTFDGTGERNTQTGVGTLTGNLHVPPFNATFRIFRILPVTLGMTLSQVGAIDGSIANSSTVSGDVALTIPLNLNLTITSVDLLGLKVPTKCSSALSLSLADNVSLEALHSGSLPFTGAATLAKFSCAGGFLGPLFAPIVSGLLSGPENPYSIALNSPA